MQENEFEKQVKQKVEGLKLNPSDSVWQNIEPHIKKEKRRRWALLLFGIFASSIIAYFVLIEILQTDNERQSTKNTKTKIQENHKDTLEKKLANELSLKENIKSSSQSISKDNVNKNNVVKMLPERKSKSFLSIHPNDFGDKETMTVAQNYPANSREIKLSTVALIENYDLHNFELKSSIKNLDKKKQLTKKDEDQTEPVTHNNKMVMPKINPLVIGFYFMPGISTVNFNNGNGQKSFGYFSADAVANPGGYGYISPSKIKSSFAYITGISIDKFISPKITFNSGINFKHFATNNLVGQDSANFIRATSNLKNYHAQFNYIELPVGFKFRLTDFKKLNFILNTGLTISYLLNTNALQFKNPPALYYHDNSLFKKVQAGLSAGIDLAITTKQKKSVLLGPLINHSLSPVASQGYYQHHFTFVGFRCQYDFTKKIN